MITFGWRIVWTYLPTGFGGYGRVQFATREAACEFVKYLQAPDMEYKVQLGIDLVFRGRNQ